MSELLGHDDVGRPDRPRAGGPGGAPTVPVPVPWRAEALGVVGAMALIGLVSSAVLAVSTGQASAWSVALDTRSWLLGAVAPGGTLLTLLPLVPVAAWSRDQPPRRRVARYVLAVLATHLAAVVLHGAVAVTRGGVGWLGWHAVLSVVLLVPTLVAVAVAAALVVGLVERWRSGRAWRATAVVRGVEVAALGLGVVLIGALVLQWLDVYLTFFGELPQPTAADGARYLVTVTACLTLVAVGLVAAVAARHRRVTVTGVVLLLLALAVGFVLAVPSGRWVDDRDEAPTGPAYEPCYSGSGDCVGG